MRPRSLFMRTALTLAAALLVFQVAVFGAIAYFVTIPMATRATDDLAALMVLAAKTWVELPPATRPDFEYELREQHGLILHLAAAPPQDHWTYLPYRTLLERALIHRLGRPVPVYATAAPEHYWADIPMAGRTLRIGFPFSRVGVQPPYALGTVFIAQLLIIVITSLWLARRLTRPLARLSAAAAQVGRGEAPPSLPENGPEELARLAGTFNRMAREVQDLLANRTTLLAGISHDLRTPLARLRLAVAMLPVDAEPELVAGIERDLEAMDRLIGQFLELARDMREDAKESVDVRELIDQVVTDARRAGGRVQWQPGTACPRRLRPLALTRILTNLIDNAQRYGDGQEVVVDCSCAEEQSVIRVLDRGPGIPAEERDAVFRPFHRLDASRNAASGGSGLGLAIARQLADANGWRIELHERAGGGTEARVILPRLGL